MSKAPLKKLKRFPPIRMYPEDSAAQKINEAYWKKKLTNKYSYAEMLRQLHRKEAESIRINGVSLTES